jgi:hypothetical protein
MFVLSSQQVHECVQLDRGRRGPCLLTEMNFVDSGHIMSHTQSATACNHSSRVFHLLWSASGIGTGTGAGAGPCQEVTQRSIVSEQRCHRRPVVAPLALLQPSIRLTSTGPSDCAQRRFIHAAAACLRCNIMQTRTQLPAIYL